MSVDVIGFTSGVGWPDEPHLRRSANLSAYYLMCDDTCIASFDVVEAPIEVIYVHPEIRSWIGYVFTEGSVEDAAKVLVAAWLMR